MARRIATRLPEEIPIIPIEEAVAKAFHFYNEFYSSGQDVRDPLLEEIVLSEEGKGYDVTIGFNRVETVPPSALDIELARAKGQGESIGDRKKLMRAYKQFRISPAGDLIGIHNKEY